LGSELETKLTDSVVNSAVDSQLQLGANTVGTAHKDRILVTSGLQVKDSTETANLDVSTSTLGGPYQRLDRIDESISSVNRDTSSGVCKSLGRSIESTVRNITPVGLSVKVDAIDRLVSQSERLCNVSTIGGDGENSASCGDDLSVRVLRSRMEDNDVCEILAYEGEAQKTIVPEGSSPMVIRFPFS